MPVGELSLVMHSVTAPCLSQGHHGLETEGGWRGWGTFISWNMSEVNKFPPSFPWCPDIEEQASVNICGVGMVTG